MRRSTLFTLCFTLAASGCATPITDIVVSPAATRSSAAQHARSRAESRALEICADVARRHGLEGSGGHYARKPPLGSYGGPTMDIIDRPPPSLISIRVAKPLGSEGGDRLALDLAQSLMREFGAASVRSRDDTWLDF